MTVDRQHPYLFEIAWEVANKGCIGQGLALTPVVGGIYTVIRTKTAVTVDEYGERYFLMGPYSYRKASMEVEEKEPQCPLVLAAVRRMRECGVRVVCGTWLVDGAPNVLLFDLGSVSHRLDEWKADLWEKSLIPSPPTDTEMNDAILLGYSVAWFLGEVIWL